MYSTVTLASHEQPQHKTELVVFSLAITSSNVKLNGGICGKHPANHRRPYPPMNLTKINRHMNTTYAHSSRLQQSIGVMKATQAARWKVNAVLAELPTQSKSFQGEKSSQAFEVLLRTTNSLGL